jgi:hypothetical protein
MQEQLTVRLPDDLSQALKAASRRPGFVVGESGPRARLHVDQQDGNHAPARLVHLDGSLEYSALEAMGRISFTSGDSRSPTAIAPPRLNRKRRPSGRNQDRSDAR